jgi:hypothetical protein
MNVYYSYSGHCPQANDEKEIDVTYTEVTITRSAKRHFKHNGFTCDDSDDCPYAAQNRCPIYNEAPITIEK